jgi:hypothetical protein
MERKYIGFERKFTTQSFKANISFYQVTKKAYQRKPSPPSLFLGFVRLDIKQG